MTNDPILIGHYPILEFCGTVLAWLATIVAGAVVIAGPSVGVILWFW